MGLSQLEGFFLLLAYISQPVLLGYSATEAAPNSKEILLRHFCTLPP